LGLRVVKGLGFGVWGVRCRVANHSLLCRQGGLAVEQSSVSHSALEEAPHLIRRPRHLSPSTARGGKKGVVEVVAGGTEEVI
jgi:hypothetical protein